MSAPIWDDGDSLALPRLENDLAVDVCVVGLGGTGLTAVHELLRLGLRVAGIDAGRLASGAAGRNGGLLLAGLADPYHRAVAAIGREPARSVYLRTLAEIDVIERTAPGSVYRTGSLRVAASPEEWEDCRLQMEAMRADGLSVEAREHPMGPALLFPQDAAFNPLARCRSLARSVVTGGALLFENSPAVSISGTLVRTPLGRVACKAVIVAVDGGVERVLPELAGSVRTARLQMLGTASAPEVSFPRPVYFRWGYDYWHQLPDGRVALGGMRDAGGEDEWTGEARSAEPIQSGLEALLRRLGVTAPITHRWAACVAYSNDGLPYIGQVRPGVWVTGAYSGTGNLIGSLCGRGLAQLVATGETTLLSELLRPSHACASGPS